MNLPWSHRGVSRKSGRPESPRHSSQTARWCAILIVAAFASTATGSGAIAEDNSPLRVRLAEQIAPTQVVLHFSTPVAARSINLNRFLVNDQVYPVQINRDPQGDTIHLTLPAPIQARTCTISALLSTLGSQLERATVEIAQRPTRGDLRISEIMYAPDTPHQTEYVEFINYTSSPLSLKELQLVVSGIAPGSTIHQIPIDLYRTLHLRQRAVLYADRRSLPGLPAVHSLQHGFPSINFDTVRAALLPLSRRDLRLNNSGATVILRNGTGATIDSLTYLPDWHHPDLVKTRGIALERIRIGGRSAAPGNWSSSLAPEGGTPGLRNSVMSTVGRGEHSQLEITPTVFSPNGDGYRDRVQIRYTLHYPVASLRTRIFDLQGRVIRTVSNSHLASQTGHFFWDGHSDSRQIVPSGIYIVHLEVSYRRNGTAEYLKKPVVLHR